MTWLIPLIVILSCWQSEARVCMNDECRLFDDLLENYNRNSRPLRNVSLPVIVNTSLDIVYLNDLDEIAHAMSTSISLNLQWYDELLVWDPGEYGGVTQISIPPMFVWFPDLLIENKYDSLGFEPLVPESENIEKLRIRSDGKVFFERKGILNTKCWVTMTHFPFDEHLCSITLVANSDTTARLRLKRLGSDAYVTEKAFNKQYGLESHCSMFGALGRPHTSDKFSYLHVAVLFARRPLVHLWNLWLPIILLALVAILVFALPADSGEKVSLGITVNLSFTVFQATIQQLLPNNTNSIPILAIFVGMMMFLTTLSLIMTVIVMRLHHSPDVSVPSLRLLAAIKSIDFMCPGTRVAPISEPESSEGNRGCSADRNTDVTELQEDADLEDDHSHEKTQKISPSINDVTEMIDTWKYVAKVLDKLFLIIFLLIFVFSTIVSLSLSFLGDYRRTVENNGLVCENWQTP